MKNEKYFDIIKKPMVTEKSAELAGEDGQIQLFKVDLKANKDLIKKAVENLFDVEVKKVRTIVVRGKVKRVGRVFGKRSNWKKAYVTLKEGHSINFMAE